MKLLATLLVCLVTVSADIASQAKAKIVTDLVWKEDPGAWHQQAARIVDHRFTTLADLKVFALDAQKAGVSVLMLVQVQKTKSCPGGWYNGLQLCDHINGTYPVADGTLEEWQALRRLIRPMRLMWWTNPSYWSVQGEAWAQASRDKTSDVGRWFSWGPEDCSGVTQCTYPKSVLHKTLQLSCQHPCLTDQGARSLHRRVSCVPQSHRAPRRTPSCRAWGAPRAAGAPRARARVSSRLWRRLGAAAMWPTQWMRMPIHGWADLGSMDSQRTAPVTTRACSRCVPPQPRSSPLMSTT